jgi:hypothetical protein
LKSKAFSWSLGFAGKRFLNGIQFWFCIPEKVLIGDKMSTDKKFMFNFVRESYPMTILAREKVVLDNMFKVCERRLR